MHNTTTDESHSHNHRRRDPDRTDRRHQHRIDSPPPQLGRHNRRREVVGRRQRRGYMLGSRPRTRHKRHRNHYGRSRTDQGRYNKTHALRAVRLSSGLRPGRSGAHTHALGQTRHRVQRAKPCAGLGARVLHSAAQRPRHGAGNVVRLRHRRLESGRIAAGRTIRNGAPDAGRSDAASPCTRSYTAR